MKLAEAVKPISYLKANAAELIRNVSAGGRPFVITQHGEAKAILIDVAAYEALQDSLALLKMLAQSRESLKRGLAKPLKKAFAGARRLIKNRGDQEI